MCVINNHSLTHSHTYCTAYCDPDSIRNWDCQYYCDDSFVFIDTFYELESAVLGYVGFFPAQRILAVVIRGTDNGSNDHHI